jgi:2-polyprenyl-3-methyl-5-hydroxy-6-metoxy-1,4-benzoquinol methylase
MKPLDRLLQHWRIKEAKAFVPKGSRLLDIGCADGLLYRMLRSHIVEYVGIDLTLSDSINEGKFRLVAGSFPKDLPEIQPFDAIAMLAVIEHLPRHHQRETAFACVQLLKQNGILILTTPSPFVDRLLDLLKGLKVIDGMSLEEHYGFDVKEVPLIFDFDELELLHHRHFQLGLNNLFVFKKISCSLT